MRIFSEDFSTPQEQAVLKIACENSLKAFIKVIHYYNNGSKFTFKPFHDEVIKALEDRVLNGNPKNLILNLPVGFGKSQIVEYFISWTFAKNPDICHLYSNNGGRSTDRDDYDKAIHWTFCFLNFLLTNARLQEDYELPLL